MHAARGLYEGLLVNSNHPPRDNPNAERAIEDRLGKLANIVVESDGIYGDLHLLKAHPMYAMLMEAGDRMPEAFCLSHNAFGDGEIINSRYVINRIPEVKSVDVVAYGGTTRSLFESEERTMTPKTIRQVIESLDAKIRKTYLPLLEMGDMCDAETQTPADSGSSGWKQHLVDAIGELVQSDDEEAHGMGAKIMGLLKPKKVEEDSEEDKSTEKDDTYGDEKKDQSNGEGDKEGDKKMKAMESRLAEFERERDVVSLCESLNKPVPARASNLFKALCALKTKDERKGLLMESRYDAPRAQGGPRSQSPGAGNSGRNGLDTESFSRALRG